MKKQNILNKSKLQKAQKAIEAGKLTNAVKILTQLCSRNSGNTSNLLLLASVHRRMNNIQGITECCQKALTIEPDNTTAIYNLATVFQAQNRIDDALNAFKQVVNLKPDHFDALVNLTKNLTNQGYYSHAIPYFKKLNELKPNNFELLFHLARCFILSKQPDNARETLHRCIELTDKTSDVYYLLADNELHSNQKNHLENALDYLESSLKADPENINASTAEAETWYRQGNFKKAHSRLNELLGKGHLNNEIIITYASLCRHFNDCDYVIEQGEKLLGKSSDLTIIQRQPLHFSLGRIHDKAGRFKEAFIHYQQGNDLESETYKPKVEENYVTNTINACADSEFKTATLKSDVPIFIIGMPRSGTTLAEQIISSHKDVYGAGELMEIHHLNGQFISTKFDFNQPLHGNAKKLTTDQLNFTAQYYLDKLNDLSETALRVTDKMPQNFLILGFIAQLFPQAKIIHCSRHPLDTIISNYFQPFTKDQSYSFKLKNIAHYYQQYKRLMDHWEETLNIDIYNLPYSNLVDDFENTCREIIDFTGLDWDDKCLHFHKSKRTVITASYDQVRSPIYKSSLDRWMHYETFLEPLRLEYPDFFIKH